MEHLLKRHWTSLLGVGFVLLACVTLFQYAGDAGWLSDGVAVAAGLLAGSGGAAAGHALLRRADWKTPGELLAGLGVAVLYTTFTFAGVYFDLWPPMIVFFSTLAVTAGVGVYAYRFRLRVLMNIGLAGALVSPLLLRPESDQVFTLFLYLFAANAVSFGVSIQKRWPELRIAAFIGTWTLYVVYYFHFEPDVWHMPFRYALAAFVFYLAALFVSSWRDGMKFEGTNLYLGIVNAVLFGLWSTELLGQVLSAGVPLLGMGAIYVGLGYAVFRAGGRRPTASMRAKLAGGVLLLLLGATELGVSLQAGAIAYVLFWESVAALLLAAGLWKRNSVLSAASVLVWLGVGAYWLFVTWETPVGVWFGTFIPFLNWGAVAWIALAAIGFVYSARLRFREASADANRALAAVWSMLSHLIVGGLLTVQTMYSFDLYDWGGFGELSLALSVAWGLYAVLLSLWGAVSRQRAFRYFGSTVLIAVAVKAVFFDPMSGEPLYRAAALLLLGGLSFAVTAVNARWRKRERGTESEQGPKQGL